MRTKIKEVIESQNSKWEKIRVAEKVVMKLSATEMKKNAKLGLKLHINGLNDYEYNLSDYSDGVIIYPDMLSSTKRAIIQHLDELCFNLTVDVQKLEAKLFDLNVKEGVFKSNLEEYIESNQTKIINRTEEINEKGDIIEITGAISFEGKKYFFSIKNNFKYFYDENRFTYKLI